MEMASSMCERFRCFSAKRTGEKDAGPEDFRQITVLSAIYRLWAKIRHEQLAEFWLPKWACANSYGLKNGNAADQMAWGTAWELQQNRINGEMFGGLCYDMQKMF